MTKSQAMTWYNKARQAAKSGKLDPERVNRAFGILQARDGNERMEKYQTTTTNCTCPDHARTHKACKHMIARMMEVRASEPAKTQRLVITAEIASSTPQRDFLYAEYDRDILTSAEQLFHAAEQGYNPVKYELIRNYRQGGRGRWVGVYQIVFEKAA